MIQIKKSKLKEAIDIGLGSQGIWTPEIATILFDEIQKQALSIGSIINPVCSRCNDTGWLKKRKEQIVANKCNCSK